MSSIKQSAQKQLETLIERYPALGDCRQSIGDALEAIIQSLRAGGKLMTCGNGGSAADAQHIVGELMKGFVLPRPITQFNVEFSARLDREFPQHAEYLKANLQSAIPAISLVGETALITAFSNDKAADLIFAQQVLGLGRAGDVLLAISTSGNSINIVYAVEAARLLGIKTIALTGRSGGRMQSLVDVSINAPADHAHTIQELHLPIYHAMCLALEAEFFAEDSEIDAAIEKPREEPSSRERELQSELNKCREEADMRERKLQSELEKCRAEADMRERELQSELEKCRAEVEQRDAEIETLKSEIVNRDKKIEELKSIPDRLNKELKTLKSDLFMSKAKIDELNSEISVYDAKAKKQKAEIYVRETKIAELMSDIVMSSAEIDKLKSTVSELRAELSQRLDEGWRLFQKYPQVSAHVRQLLNGVFTRENDFMSFICGGAQTNSLETLWDVRRECVMHDQQQDEEILRAIFVYCLQLVSASKIQARYSLLPVREGDRFDSDVHIEGPNSRAQGRIVRVYLAGYRNDYNGKIIRKSIVQVQ